jgi:hypothetical protein
VSPAACSEIKFLNVDQPQRSGLLRGQLPQSEQTRFFKRHKANCHRAILGYDLVSTALGRLKLRR